MTNLEKVEKLVNEYTPEQLLIENRADMMPFFDLAFETLLTEEHSDKGEFLSILDSTLIRFEVPADIKQSVWNQIAFLMFTLTQSEEQVPEISIMVNDVPGFVLIQSCSEFLLKHPVSAQDADFNLILRWSYLLRMLYVLAYSAEPMMETGLGIITQSVQISDLWYAAGAWEEVMKISDTTLEFAEALWKSQKLPCHFAIMLGILWYHRGVAQKNGYNDGKSQKESYTKALSYLEGHNHDNDAEIEAVISDCRKTLGR